MRKAVIYVGIFIAAIIFAFGGCGRKEEKKEESKEETTKESTEETGKETKKKKKNKKKTEVQETPLPTYGVFLGVDRDSFQISDFDDYETVVVDALELRKEQLAQLHSSGHTVYSYLNVGSVEDSRDYYDRFSDLLLDGYKNWPEEDWVDVTDDRWKNFVTGDLPDRIRDKDPAVDGFFLDNLDIYGHIMDSKDYREMGKDTYKALTAILESYHDADIPVIVNGADEFVVRLIKDGNTRLIKGVNQETVFTRIKNYKRDKFKKQDKEEQDRLTAYLKKCADAGIEIFLLEYTKDDAVAEEIKEFCGKNRYRYYISKHVNLIGTEK